MDNKSGVTNMICVSKKQLKDVAGVHDMVGPIAEGETPARAATRMAKQLGYVATHYAYTMRRTPLAGKNQQFPVIIGTVWAR